MFCRGYAGISVLLLSEECRRVLLRWWECRRVLGGAEGGGRREEGAYMVVGGEGMPLGADQAKGEQVAWRSDARRVGKESRL